jgi:hypothetical protein
MRLPAVGRQGVRGKSFIAMTNHAFMAIIISAPKISLESKSQDEMGGLSYQEDPYHQ